MGCCMSSVPTFDPSSLADGILPPAPPGNENFQIIKIVPQQGTFGRASAIYLPKDASESPSYFLTQGGVLCRRIEGVDGQADKHEVLKIKSGWQSSKGYNVGGTEFNEYNNNIQQYVTTYAKKTITLTAQTNGAPGTQVVMVKEFDKAKSADKIEVEIDSGYEVKLDSKEQCAVVTKDGRIVAYVYDGMKQIGPHQMMMMGPMALMKAMKAPAAMFIDQMSETDLEMCLAVICAANERLLQSASLNIGGDGGNHGGGGHHGDGFVVGGGGGGGE